MNTGNSHIICQECLECIDCGLCKCGKSTLNFRHIEHAIQSMKPHSTLFKIIKAELIKRGHWKNLARGWARAGKKNPSPFKK